MEQGTCIDSKCALSHKDEEASFENESELNTADLSEISGLSKILQADDSIADRVRCLLASDSEEGDRERPQLLDSVKELTSTNDLSERISKLLQDGSSDTHGNSSVSNPSRTANQKNQEQESVLTCEDGLNSTIKSDEKFIGDVIKMPAVTDDRRSGDGADNEPATIVIDSADDIMNVSDATEYSDLPKVVDNPIKKVSAEYKSDTILESVNEDGGKPELGEKIDDEQSNVDFSFLKPKGDYLMHSAPHSTQAMSNFRDSERSVAETSPLYDRKSADAGNGSEFIMPRHLSDDKILGRIRQAVSNCAFSSSSLKGPHTSSEQSIASSVDSLGLKVKSLLKMKQPESVLEADTSTTSNYSEEIKNFEKTNLWKYTRQFMPGTSSHVQPLTKFSESSPICVKDTTSESSACTTPVIYRLARELITPVNESDRYSSRVLNSDSNSRNVSSHSGHDIMTSDALKSRLENTPRGNQINTETCPQPSTHSYKSAALKDERTPDSDAYQSLRPQYSDTPYTPYSFITPRRAWELEIAECSTSYKQKKTPPMERSSYFHRDLSGIQKSPSPMQRSSRIPYRRLSPEKLITDSQMKTFARKDKTTSTAGHFVSNSDYEVSVKPVTPPPSPGSYFKKSNLHQDVANISFKKQTTPKTVSFSRPNSVSLSNKNNVRQDLKSSSLPEYSFTTPKVSDCPKRNITPKVNKKNPRPCRSLPTYDQLVAEEESDKSNIEKDTSTVHEKSAQSDNVSTDVGKVSTKSDGYIRSSTPTGPIETDTFSVLKPEICLDQSQSDDVLPTPEKEPNVFKHSIEDMTSSDLRIRSAISCNSEVVSSSDDLVREPIEREAVNHKISLERKDSGSPPVATEPAPLPYVRLGRKRPISPFQKSYTPPQRSISAEKVQNLLLREKLNPHTRNASDAASFPPKIVDNPSSSDEDLLLLMENLATKIPLMQDLLKKLYNRNLEKTKKRTPVKRKHYTSNTVDQSVQTCSTLGKNVPDDVPMHGLDFGKPNGPSLHLITDTGCQTSFVRPKKRILIAHKATSPVEDFDSPVEDSTILPTKSTTPAKSSSKRLQNGDKENEMGPRRSCAFFVDVTSERSQDNEKETTSEDKIPVAWYEPYEYIPPWRIDEQAHRKTLGFVDANIQDAFLNNKRNFVLRSWERQEDIAIRAEERRLKELEQRIHDQIQALHKKNTFKIAPPTSQPVKAEKKKEPVFGWKEMKLASKQKYDALPEVVAKKKDAERLKYYEANRKRAEMYKRRITHLVVQKQRQKATSGGR